MSGLTEKEAAGCWCPFARYAHEHAPYTRNRTSAGSKLDTGTRCLASGCMAWRWSDRDGAPKYYSGDPGYCPDERQGYCGLAGKPEFAS